MQIATDRTHCARLLYYRAIGDGIGERDPEFDYICAASLHGSQNGHCIILLWITCSDEGDQRWYTLKYCQITIGVEKSWRTSVFFVSKTLLRASMGSG